MLQLICIKNRMFLTFKHVSEMFALSHHKMFGIFLMSFLVLFA